MSINDADIIQIQYNIAYFRDQRAYQQLFIHFHPKLSSFTYSIVRNRETAEEIVSDVMMKIWEMGSRLTEIKNLRVYLFTCIKNASVTYLTSRKIKYVDIETMDFNEIYVADAEKLILQTELKQQIECAIRSLPCKCQWVFRLIKEEGCSYKEVSSILNISPNTVENHMQAAFKKISHCLEEYLRSNQ